MFLPTRANDVLLHHSPEHLVSWVSDIQVLNSSIFKQYHCYRVFGWQPMSLLLLLMQ